MLVVNLAVALVVSVFVWYAASRALAQLIVVTETRNPKTTTSASWHAVETGLTFAVFLGSVACWIGLTYLLERLSH